MVACTSTSPGCTRGRPIKEKSFPPATSTWTIIPLKKFLRQFVSAVLNLPCLNESYHRCLEARNLLPRWYLQKWFWTVYHINAQRQTNDLHSVGLFDRSPFQLHFHWFESTLEWYSYLQSMKLAAILILLKDGSLVGILSGKSLWNNFWSFQACWRVCFRRKINLLISWLIGEWSPEFHTLLDNIFNKNIWFLNVPYHLIKAVNGRF